MLGTPDSLKELVEMTLFGEVNEEQLQENYCAQRTQKETHDLVK